MTFASDRIEPHVWRLAIVIVLGAIMSILDTTVVNVAIDTLARDLHSSLAQVQWVATAYMLALAAVIPLTGWLSRRVGAKPLYVVSLVLFTAGSVLCGFAWDTGSLVVFRILQGLGGGMLMPVGQMMLARAAGPQRMGRVMSVVGVPMLLAPVFGPALGGLLLDHLGWRWIFFVNVPIGLVAFALALRLLPPTRPERGERIDALGFLLLGVGLPALTYGLAELGNGGAFATARVGGAMLGGLALVVLFALHALRVERPLLDVRLFRNGAFSAAAVTTFALGGALFGAMILFPLYFQTVRGETAVVTGLLLAPQGLGAAIAMPLSGRLTDRIGGGIVSLAGVALTALATVPFAFVDETTSYVEMSAALVLRGLGIGVAMMPAMAAAYAVLRRDQVSDATPQLNVIQRVGGSIGTAILAVVLARQIREGGRGVHALGGAYAHTYWWVVAITAAALLPAVVLAHSERLARLRRHAHAAAAGEAG